MLYDFFSQRFAQVTNPPLDSIREKMVTSLFTHLGAQADVLNPTPEAAHRIHLDTPVLDNQQLANIVGAANSGEGKFGAFKAATVSGFTPWLTAVRGCAKRSIAFVSR